MKEIELIGGDKALVDDEDYEWLIEKYVWKLLHSRSNRYCRSIYKNYDINTQDVSFFMHRLIMEKYYGKSKLKVDHKDRNGLNNQKSNLRYATNSQNSVNIAKYKKNSTSQYKGVYFLKDSSKWHARFSTQGIALLDKSFLFEREAAIAYDIMVTKHFPEFVVLNCPDATEQEIQNVRDYLNNPKKYKDATSKYIGVCKNGDRWLAITKDTNDNKIHIGTFSNELDAAKAYNIITAERGRKDLVINDIVISEEDKSRIMKKINNPKKYTDTYSSYLCVTRNKKRWMSRFYCNGKTIHVGTFDTEKEAVIAYNKKAFELLGDQAKLNIID